MCKRKLSSISLEPIKTRELQPKFFSKILLKISLKNNIKAIKSKVQCTPGVHYTRCAQFLFKFLFHSGRPYFPFIYIDDPVSDIGKRHFR